MLEMNAAKRFRPRFRRNPTGFPEASTTAMPSALRAHDLPDLETRYVVLYMKIANTTHPENPKSFPSRVKIGLW